MPTQDGNPVTDAMQPWVVPEPLAACDVQTDEDAVVTLRRHGNPDGPRLVMSHGNGLAVDLYYPFWSELTDEYDVIVYDLRNHGWNALSPLERHNVPTLVDDHDRILEAIDAEFGAKPKVGVFHSVSALITLLSPARGAPYDALVLFDPPLRRPNVSDEQFDEASMRTAALARRRTAKFRSREEFAQFLRLVPLFLNLAPGVRELMAETTLRENGAGEGYVLRCPPEYEAQIIDYARIFSLAVDFEEMLCPVKVIGADPTLPYSYLPSLDLSDVAIVDYDFIPDATHFLPLEHPHECASGVREFLAQRAG